MCEYCDGMFRRKRIMVYKREFDDGFAIMLTDYKTKQRMIFYEINYCPMCGRKLVE